MIGQKKKYSIVLLEPSPIVTAGIKELLASQPGWEVTNSFTDMNRLQERMSSLHPDILILNPVLIDYSKRLHVRALFPDRSDLLLFALLYSYVDADILRQYNGTIDITDDVADVVRKLKQGIDSNNMPAEAGEGYELSERENEILAAVARGLTNKEIADKYNISIHTVISHRKNITRKTGIKTVSGLTVYALLNNLIDQSEIE